MMREPQRIFVRGKQMTVPETHLGASYPNPIAPPSGCHFHPRCPLTRQAAADADAKDTVEIESGGERFRVSLARLLLAVDRELLEGISRLRGILGRELDTSGTSGVCMVGICSSSGSVSLSSRARSCATC
jgi:hypothetical protein